MICKSMSYEPKEVSWDGSDIGPIDNSIILHKKFEYNTNIDFVVDDSGKSKLVKVKIIKYKNDLPFIIDEMKYFFNIKQTGKHKGTYKNEPCIIVYVNGDITLDTYLTEVPFNRLSEDFITQVRNIYIFRWFMCLTCNFSTIIDVRNEDGHDFPICYREGSCSFSIDNNKSKISKTIIKKWFKNDYILLDDCMKAFVYDKDANLIKFKLLEIIKKYDRNLIYLSNAVFDRLIQMS